MGFVHLTAGHCLAAYPQAWLIGLCSDSWQKRRRHPPDSPLVNKKRLVWKMAHLDPLSSLIYLLNMGGFSIAMLVYQRVVLSHLDSLCSPGWWHDPYLADGENSERRTLDARHIFFFGRWHVGL